MAPLPAPHIADAESWVRAHLDGLHANPDDWSPSRRFRGGQRAADTALAGFDGVGYAARRNEVLPPSARGASALSPYIRHGLISLSTAWAHVGDAPQHDHDKFRDELLWQEYARHLYVRLGAQMASPLRFAPPTERSVDGWWARHDMACLDAALSELDGDGWMPNQMRMWLASHWAVREGANWVDGERRMFRELLDGSCANRAGWQWTIGTATGRPYGFSRSQVERRAPGLCDTCALSTTCPIADWPDADDSVPLTHPVALRRGDHPPLSRDLSPNDGSNAPAMVWLTAESLGDADPALAAHPDLPVIFVFDAPLLRGLRLHPRRLVFMVECLADLGERREVFIDVGDPVDVLPVDSLAVTAAPVPGFGVRAAAVRPAATYAWPWLVPPTDGPLGSFSAWRRGVGQERSGGPRQRSTGRRRRR